MLLGAFVGLRLAEVAALRVSDIDFMRGVVSPTTQYPTRPLKSGTSPTPIPIPSNLALMLSVRFHDLRHYFASLLIAAGLDVKVVQARLRHASAMTTLNTYGHMWPDKDESSRAAVAVALAAREDNPRTKGVVD